MDLLRTKRTFKTRDGAVKALKAALGQGDNLQNVRYLVAVNEAGRYAPVLVGVAYLAYAHVGITVVGG